jgi:hypothetical protein
MALSADYSAKRQGSDVYSGKVKASTTIYAGSLVVRLTASGLLQPGADATATHFAGVAKNQVTGNAAGTSTLDLYKTGTYEFTCAAATITSIGVTAFVSTDDTVAAFATPTNKTPCGKIVDYVSSTKVKVCIDGYATGHTNGLGDS